MQIGFPFVRESPRFGQRCIPPSRFRISLYASKESRQTRGESRARGRRGRRGREERGGGERSRGKRRLAITGGGTSLFDSWEGEVVRGVSHGARANVLVYYASKCQERCHASGQDVVNGPQKWSNGPSCSLSDSASLRAKTGPKGWGGGSLSLSPSTTENLPPIRIFSRILFSFITIDYPLLPFSFKFYLSIDTRRVYEVREIGGLLEIDCFLKLRSEIDQIDYCLKSFVYRVKFSSSRFEGFARIVFYLSVF